MTGRKRKKKSLICLLLCYGWTSLGVSLFEAYFMQYCCNLRARHPWVRCRSPGRLRHDSLLNIKSRAGQSRSASRELGPWAGRGMSTSRNPWTGGSLRRLKHDNLLRTKSLGKSRQVDLLGPPDWSWASPISPV